MKMTSWKFLAFCGLLLTGFVRGDDDVYRKVNIDHFSIGGSPSILTELNHLNMQTIVLLNARFSHNNTVSSWQFYASSLMPFYPSIWRVAENSGRTYTVELVGFNKVVPVKTGYQEFTVLPGKRITTSPGDVLGIFYAVEDQLEDLVLGTVPIEIYAKEPTDGVTDDMITSVVDSTPHTALDIGYQFTAKAGNKTARLLAMRAVYEPEFNLRAIPSPIQDQFGVSDMNTCIPEFNVDRKWGTICDDGSHNITLAWGDEACRRLYKDPDFAMVMSFKVDTTLISHVPVPIAPPLLYNPTCFPNKDQMFAEGCASGATCDISSTRAIVCANKDKIPKLQKKVSSEKDDWNFVA